MKCPSCSNEIRHNKKSHTYKCNKCLIVIADDNNWWRIERLGNDSIIGDSRIDIIYIDCDYMYWTTSPEKHKLLNYMLLTTELFQKIEKLVVLI